MPAVRKWSPLFFVSIFIIALDQISKNWVIDNMVLGQSLVLLPELHPYLQLTRSYNTGAAFGIFPDAGPAFLILSILITMAMLFFYAQSSTKADLMHIGFGLVIGGAVGNVIDRLQHGHVIDFVHIRIPGVVSNVSNFADHAIVIGVAFLLIDSAISEWARRREMQPDTTAPDEPADNKFAPEDPAHS